MTKDELLKYKDTKKELTNIKYKIEELEEKKTSIKSQIITDMPRGNADKDRLGLLLVQIEELVDLYNIKQCDLLEEQFKIENVIDSLDTLERTVIRYVYFENKRYEEISCLIKYSYRTVRRIHKRALDKLDKLDRQGHN